MRYSRRGGTFSRVARSPATRQRNPDIATRGAPGPKPRHRSAEISTSLRRVSLRLCAVARRSLSLRMCFRATCRLQQQSSRGLILRKRHQIFLIFFHKFLFRSPLERDLFVCPGLHWGLLRWVAPWRAALAAILASLLRRPAACADPLAPVAAQGCKSNPAEAATAIKQKDAGKKSLGLSP